MRKHIAVTVTLAALALPAAAGAHVTLKPNQAPAGGFARLDVRVPNERDNAATTKVDLQLPPGFVGVSYAPYRAGPSRSRSASSPSQSRTRASR